MKRYIKYAIAIAFMVQIVLFSQAQELKKIFSYTNDSIELTKFTFLNNSLYGFFKVNTGWFDEYSSIYKISDDNLQLIEDSIAGRVISFETIFKDTLYFQIRDAYDYYLYSLSDAEVKVIPRSTYSRVNFSDFFEFKSCLYYSLSNREVYSYKLYIHDPNTGKDSLHFLNKYFKKYGVLSNIGVFKDKMYLSIFVPFEAAAYVFSWDGVNQLERVEFNRELCRDFSIIDNSILFQCDNKLILCSETDTTYTNSQFLPTAKFKNKYFATRSDYLDKYFYFNYRNDQLIEIQPEKDIIKYISINEDSVANVSNFWVFFNDMLVVEVINNSGLLELWMYDAAGNFSLVKNLGLKYIPVPIQFKNNIYFLANDSVHGTELWTLDRDYNLSLVKDIAKGKKSSEPKDFYVFNNRLFFTADDSIHGRELWAIDEANNVYLVEDIVPGEASSSPFAFAEYNDVLYFQTSPSLHTSDIWQLTANDLIEKKITACESYTDSDGKTHFNGAFLSYNSSDSRYCEVTVEHKTTHTYIDACEVYSDKQGNIFTESTTLVDTIAQPDGCDSVLVTHINIEKDKQHYIDYIEMCGLPTPDLIDQPKPFCIDGCIYYDTIVAENGCTRYYTTIEYPFIMEKFYDCNSVQLPDGRVVSESGLYRDMDDTTLFYNVLVADCKNTQTFISACNEFTTNSGEIYYESFFKIDTLYNEYERFHVHTTNCTIEKTDTISIDVTAEKYISPLGDTVYEPGNYTFFDSYVGECGTLYNVSLNAPNGIQSHSEDISLQPTIVTNVLTVSSQKIITGDVCIIDALGNELLCRHMANEYKSTFDLTNFAQGKYTLVFERNGFTETYPFVKIK